jgi:broad specificity phosphatase PhoE
LKHPLTEKGISQTEELSKIIANRKILKIFSSPILRALQTSMILGKKFDVEIEIEPALREFDVGIYEGRSDKAGWLAYRDVVHAWIDDGKHTERMESGESFTDQVTRFEPFLKKVTEHYQNTDGTVVLVTHGGLIRCMLPHLISNLSFKYCEQHPIMNTTYVALKMRDNKLICTEWCGQILN